VGKCVYVVAAVVVVVIINLLHRMFGVALDEKFEQGDFTIPYL
jgi:hypothetical protein